MVDNPSLPPCDASCPVTRVPPAPFMRIEPAADASGVVAWRSLPVWDLKRFREDTERRRRQAGSLVPFCPGMARFAGDTIRFGEGGTISLGGIVTARPRAERESREWTASVNDTELRVEEIGSGEPTVVFSPNPFTNRALFADPVAALSSDYRCVRYDHRGQGESGFGVPQPSPDLLGTEGLYDDAVALLDQLGIDHCHWVGSSIGGFVGVRLAARHPDRIRSLTLVGFSTRRLSRADLRQVDAMIRMVQAGRRLGPLGSALLGRVTDQVMLNMFGPTFMSDPARTDARELWRERFMALMVPEAAPMFRSVFGHPGTPPELLALVQAPTLIVAGGDELARFDEARDDLVEAEQVIPDARLVTIPGAGLASGPPSRRWSI
jgi:3-oxoadipate enol-lactonase